jgi:hypothetical protein
MFYFNNSTVTNPQVDAWKAGGDESKVAAAKDILKVGQLLTATEVRSSKRYWHVMQNDETKRIYPSIYKQNVIGILWSTMAEFGTYFGSEPYLPYGIQLLPLTPIAEERDDLSWAFEMYKPFAKMCREDSSCGDNGWSILVLAILATVGHTDLASKKAQRLSSNVFNVPGGNGHSKSNTLWYIATRAHVETPLSLDGELDVESLDDEPGVALNCYRPDTCTDQVLDTLAGEYSCRDRIIFLMDSMGNTMRDACTTVGSVEFPLECGHCNPPG